MLRPAFLRQPDDPIRTACRKYGLPDNDIKGLLKRDTPGQFHTHKALRPKRGHIPDMAVCKTCGKVLGKYCPKAPDHICDYKQPTGAYDETHCRWCGRPEREVSK